jgi:hypothetical protein
MPINQRLQFLAELFANKEKAYGEQYKEFGQFMMLLLGPIEIKTVADYNKIMTIFNIVTKVGRICKAFKLKIDDEDSPDDLAIYSMILQELNND